MEDERVRKRKASGRMPFFLDENEGLFYSIFRYGKFDEMYEVKFQLLRNGDLQYIE